MSEPKYPWRCRTFGHDHSGYDSWETGGVWTTHREQCKRRYWCGKRYEHIETFEEAFKDAINAEPPAPPPAPPSKEIHVYHHNIKKGNTIYISGMNRTKPKKMLVVSVTKKGEAQELGVEEAA